MKKKYFLVILLFCSLIRSVSGTTLYVDTNKNGDGTEKFPFHSIQEALDATKAGDIVIIRPGTYTESLILTAKTSGTDDAPILIRSEQERGSVIITYPGTVFQTKKWIDQQYVTIEGIIFDGQYGDDDTVTLHVGANFFTLRNVEIRRSGRDCLDMASPDNVIIENSLIHHCLWWENGERKDAHGIAAGGNGRLENLIIRNTTIHTFSGDGFQIDPNRNAKGWNNILIDHCDFWVKPFENGEETNGFPVGSVPGENAIDTKTGYESPRGTIFIRNTKAHGFQNGFIDVMAAFNIKERVTAFFDGITTYDNEYSFRIRGKDREGYSRTTIINTIIYNSTYAIRLEENVEEFRLYNTTFGKKITNQFQYGGPLGQTNILEIKNLLVLGTKIKFPSEIIAVLDAQSNLTVDETSFVNVEKNDYHLTENSPALNSGVDTSPIVMYDLSGIKRMLPYDIGAYEYNNGIDIVSPSQPTNFHFISQKGKEIDGKISR